jgi:hypothetical protein
MKIIVLLFLVEKVFTIIFDQEYMVVEYETYAKQFFRRKIVTLISAKNILKNTLKIKATIT